MGTYFNPSNESFREDSGSEIYVDKTGLLELLNARIHTSMKCIALSHARRFGKSQAAGMIDAYYSKGCDSRELFSKFEIAKTPDFEEHLNKYNVIHLDISSFADRFTSDLVDRIWKAVHREMQATVPDLMPLEEAYASVLMDACEKTGRTFVIIIDEWDCVIRNLADRPDLVHRYLQFLHSIFKSEESRRFLALGWITGILPIKKIEDESALNNFREYTMLSSNAFTPFFGFTEDEVRGLCARYGTAFESLKQWYDGYLISGRHMYNPNSVVSALTEGELASYWKNTSAYSSINRFITLNFSGLKGDILTMLAGGSVKVTPEKFANDLSVIRSKDEALAALIHLGYLGWDADRRSAFVPNFEVADAFRLALETGNWKEISDAISMCNNLLDATIACDAGKVAEILDEVHGSYSSILKFNDENSLAAEVHMAYFSARAYFTIVRELPTGKGFADFAFIPRPEAGSMPAIIMELKWNESADTAIRQIKDRRYTGLLANRKEEILLVGISYDKDSPDKKHTCVIEKVDGLVAHEQG